MSGGSDSPLVSGISPKEGLPGTKVTIRGDNLGTRKEDITCEFAINAPTNDSTLFL